MCSVLYVWRMLCEIYGEGFVLDQIYRESFVFVMKRVCGEGRLSGGDKKYFVLVVPMIQNFTKKLS